MTKDLATQVNIELAWQIEHMKQGLEFIDQNIGYGGNGEGWLASDNDLVVKALLKERSARFDLDEQEWQRLESIMGKPWVATARDDEQET